MKIKLLSALISALGCVSFAYSQSVVITPKKVVYNRPKPTQDFKKTFAVTRPQVKAATPALSKKIETAISYEKNNNFNLKEEMSEFQWLEDASYEVKYNKNGLLDIILSMEGSAAYPSSFSKEVVIDTKTGNQIIPASVFTNLKSLAAKIKSAQQIEIKKAIVDIKKDNPEEENPASLFTDSNYTVKNLDEFSVSDKGATFLYNYEFPHVIQAWQPDGRYFFTWAQLKPFVKPDGLFGKFIR